jgi:hypothetical protein
MARILVQASRLLLLGFAWLAGDVASASAQAPKLRFASNTPAEAEKWQEEARKTVFKLLQMADLQETRAPGNKAIPFKPKQLRSADRGKYVWSEWEIQSTETRKITVVVTIPQPAKPGEKFPAAVCIHGHDGNRSIVYDRKSVYRGFAAELAERGFVTVSTDVGQHDVYEKGRALMGERLWDVLRCADYAAQLPEVDGKRLACAGLSLGGEMAMWLGAIDPRMRATVSSGFLTTVANMRRGHCQCWDFPGLTQNFEFSDVYSLTAPRPLLCQIGRKEQAPGGFPAEIAEGAMKEVRKAYKVFGAEDKARLDIHGEGHVFDVKPAVEFLESHLR